MFCSLPETPENAILPVSVQKKYPVSAQVRFPCIEGYTADGLASGPDFVQMECASNGNFVVSSLFLGECQPVNCGRPPEIFYAQVSSNLQHTELRFGDIAAYTCVGNFTTPTGKDFRLSCQSNGVFQDPPVCSTVSCGPPPPQANAQPLTLAPVPLGEAMRYSCDEGFAVYADKYSFDLKCDWHPIDKAPYYVEVIKQRCLPVSCCLFFADTTGSEITAWVS